MSERQQLGALLVQGGLLSKEALDAALLEQASSGKSLGRILIDGGLVTEADLVATLAAQIGLDYVDLAEATIDPAATTLITPALSPQHPRRGRALTRLCPWAGAANASWSRWPTRPTSSPSTTSAPSPGRRSRR